MKSFFKKGHQFGQDIISYNNATRIAIFYRDQDWLDTGLNLYRTITTTRERVLGKEHPYTLMSINKLGLVLKDKGKYSESE
jgi:hypothetical protein